MGPGGEGTGPGGEGHAAEKASLGRSGSRSAAGLGCPRDYLGNQLPVTLPWGLCCSGYPCPLESFHLHQHLF